MTPPVREARNPTLMSTSVMSRPLLWRCSVTHISRPTALWTNRDENRHHRNTQYHISANKTHRHRERQREQTGQKVSWFPKMQMSSISFRKHMHKYVSCMFHSAFFTLILCKTVNTDDSHRKWIIKQSKHTADCKCSMVEYNSEPNHA